MRRLLLWVLISAALISNPIGVSASPDAVDGLTIIVNSSLADAPDKTPGDGVCETDTGNGVCTLRAAVMEANAFSGEDTIQIPAGTFVLDRTGYDNTALNGDLDLTGDVVITGAGTGDTTIDGNGNVTEGRVFQVLPGATVRIRDLRITDGNGVSGAPDEYGGGVRNDGTLTLERVSLFANHAHYGGGLMNFGTLFVYDSFINQNTVTIDGAGLYSFPGSSVTIERSSISHNNAGSNAGGLHISQAALVVRGSAIYANGAVSQGGGFYLFQSTVRIENSVLYGNFATSGGGGLSNGSAVVMLNSTVSGNLATIWGGGLTIQIGTQPVYLYNVTVAGNVADSDNDATGGGGGVQIAASGILRVANSIIAGNVLERGIADAPDDCFGELESLGYNLIQTTDGCTITGVTTGNRTAVAPMLGALGNHGGPTLVRPLLTGSPAIDAGNPAGCSNDLGAPLMFDQRGFFRSIDGGLGEKRCDIGAYEYDSPEPQPMYLPLALRQ